MSNTLLVLVLLLPLSFLVGCGQSGADESAADASRAGETASASDGAITDEESTSIESGAATETVSMGPQLSAPTGDLRFPAEVEAAMMGEQNQPALRATQPQIYLEPITPNPSDK